jgi:hypothetical protein
VTVPDPHPAVCLICGLPITWEESKAESPPPETDTRPGDPGHPFPHHSRVGVCPNGHVRREPIAPEIE